MASSLNIHLACAKWDQLGRKTDKQVAGGGGHWVNAMTLKILGSSVLFCMLGACATVDIADMTTMGGDLPAAEASSTNVVLNASDKLYAAFEEKGLCLSQKARAKYAAEAFLKGREALSNHPDNAYASQGLSMGTIKADIVDASALQESTSKAAEVYLELAPTDADLRPELKKLEHAIYASQSAQRQFDIAIKQSEPGALEEMKSYQAAAEKLRVITNSYGDRVRLANQNQTQLGS